MKNSIKKTNYIQRNHEEKRSSKHLMHSHIDI